MFSIIISVIFIGILFYTAMIYNSSAMVLLAFAWAVFVILAILYLVYRRLTMRFGLEIPIGVADAGTKNLVSVKAWNGSPFICPRIKLCMVCRNTLLETEQKKWLKASDILPGNSTVDYYLKFPAAGNYEVQIKKLRIYDLAGILYWQISGKKRREIASAGIRILPEIYSVGICLTEQVRNYYGETDSYDEDKAGPDNSEIFRIRPFADGDKIQSIHWKLSARMDEMMVKENSLPKACAIILLLDCKKKLRIQQEAFLTIAASLSFSLMDGGCPHYIAWYEEKSRDVTRIRVDDEESYYLFLNCYMQDGGEGSGENLPEQYREKYRTETHIYMLRLTEELILYKNAEELVRFNGNKLKEELGGTEIVL